MDTLINLLKEYRVGDWCKRAAWIIAAIGLVEIILDSYATISQYQYPGTHFLPGALLPLIAAQVLRFALSIVSPMIFYFFILYAAGVLVNHFVPDTEEDDADEMEEEEDMLVDEEDGEEIAPGQMR